MAKTVIKEIIIMLLLCLAIILLLGILLYEYVPMTKTIPNLVSYTTPDNVKQELADTDGIDESQIIMTYEVDSTDLNNYKSIQNYKPGKANPFSSYETKGTNGTSTTTANSSSGNNETLENETSSNPSSSSGTSNSESVTTVDGGTSQTTDTDNSPTTITPQESTSTNTNTSTSGGQFFQDKGTK